MKLCSIASGSSGNCIYVGSNHTNLLVDVGISAELLFIEANHDINMLMVGKYPYHLKQRILGDRGHLSNDTSADLISKLIHPKLKHILLAHLSKENNYEELAYETVCCELMSRGSSFLAENISVAHREQPSRMVTI